MGFEARCTRQSPCQRCSRLLAHFSGFSTDTNPYSHVFVKLDRSGEFPKLTKAQAKRRRQAAEKLLKQQQAGLG